ncbi:SDR family oxidoreductase [Pseudobacter ginsenosidimutans]|jgi:dTDP-4-dehydrorhamnose reductase|uniref:dTDP-4-dehydrorhamnose reductase n=1 Tax=Pseudobacter ginsenosidimutans TaxID=661488 RepID=A0A4Q7MGU9_9BACT|nr:SDR family oxidoreductase [Pseudobacter ginsenosidimutans]QEC45355.1 SDR family oxidoreductase [Pseudobacter ginsenosidimutans]RZS66877.1 dTDP-4-dehydrorhamnose reductase [Pseudobacter ginsenosidimutans]
MKILITGANGLLGQHLVQELLHQQFTVLATSKGPNRLPFEPSEQFRYRSLDITDELNLEKVMEEERPDVIVHAASMTQVDECEKNTELCEKVNVYGTTQLLVDAEAFSKYIIYVSTDFVFDGLNGLYREDDDLRPVNFYGFTKMQAEAIMHTSEIPWAIVRTCLVYGNPLQGTRSNIVNWVRESLQEGESIKVVSDQMRTPTYVGDLAKGLVEMIKRRSTGIYHLSGKEQLTPYQMALKTADHFSLDKSLITEVTADTFTQPAKRPPRTGFDISKAEKDLDYKPMTFEEGLQQMGETGIA